MGECTHSLAEKETQCYDGFCPMCIVAERGALQKSLDEMAQAWKKAESDWRLIYLNQQKELDESRALICDMRDVITDHANACIHGRVEGTHLCERCNHLVDLLAHFPADSLVAYRARVERETYKEGWNSALNAILSACEDNQIIDGTSLHKVIEAKKIRALAAEGPKEGANG